MSKDNTDWLDEILNRHSEIGLELRKDILAHIAKVEKEAQLGLLDYFDQVPTNDSMDWKGLFADTRKLLQEEQQ